MNRARIDWIVSNVLSEEFVLEVLRQLRHRLAERAKTTTSDVPQLEVRRMEAEAKMRIAEARTMLERNPEEARRVVGALFPGPLTVAPVETADGKRFWIHGSAAIGRLFAADGGGLDVASPAGFEPA